MLATAGEEAQGRFPVSVGAVLRRRGRAAVLRGETICLSPVQREVVGRSRGPGAERSPKVCFGPESSRWHSGFAAGG